MIHKIVGEILSISYENLQPIALVELRDGSEAFVIIDNKFHPLFKCGDDGLFEGSWSADINNSESIKLFIAEFAFDNFMKVYGLDYWRKFIGQFSASELREFCGDSAINERNFQNCLNFHIAALDRFSALLVLHTKNKDIDEAESCFNAVNSEIAMILEIARVRNMDMSKIESLIEAVNNETSTALACDSLNATLGKVSTI